MQHLRIVTCKVCKYEICFIDPPCLPVIKTIKPLGFIINGKLNWDSHIDYVCRKSAQRLHVLRKLRAHISPRDLHVVYTSLIRSLLEYASALFGGLNKKLSERLVKVRD